MPSFHECVAEYKKQLEKGAVKLAYRGLMEYMMALRTHFQKNHPAFSVSGAVYQGYMDMSYFSLVPDSLKSRKLKIALVFIHEKCAFEIWLSGINRQVQENYWALIKKNGWDKYRLVPSIKGSDSILEYVLDENPDFNDLDGLTKQIEKKVLKFSKDVEGYLGKVEK